MARRRDQRPMEVVGTTCSVIWWCSLLCWHPNITASVHSLSDEQKQWWTKGDDGKRRWPSNADYRFNSRQYRKNPTTTRRKSR